MSTQSGSSESESADADESGETGKDESVSDESEESVDGDVSGSNNDGDTHRSRMERDECEGIDSDDCNEQCDENGNRLSAQNI